MSNVYGITPKIEHYGSMVDILDRAGRLHSLEPHVDGDYVLLSNIYFQAKKWDEVVNVRRMMKNTNIKKVLGSSSIEVGNAVHEFVAG